MAPPLGPLTLPVQPRRHVLSLGGPAADSAEQFALNVEVLLEFSPPEGWDRGKGMAVARRMSASTAPAGHTVV